MEHVRQMSDINLNLDEKHHVRQMSDVNDNIDITCASYKLNLSKLQLFSLVPGSRFSKDCENAQTSTLEIKGIKNKKVVRLLKFMYSQWTRNNFTNDLPRVTHKDYKDLQEASRILDLPVLAMLSNEHLLLYFKDATHICIKDLYSLELIKYCCRKLIICGLQHALQNMQSTVDINELFTIVCSANCSVDGEINVKKEMIRLLLDQGAVFQIINYMHTGLGPLENTIDILQFVFEYVMKELYESNTDKWHPVILALCNIAIYTNQTDTLNYILIGCPMENFITKEEIYDMALLITMKPEQHTIKKEVIEVLIDHGLQVTIQLVIKHIIHNDYVHIIRTLLTCLKLDQIIPSLPEMLAHIIYYNRYNILHAFISDYKQDMTRIIPEKTIHEWWKYATFLCHSHGSHHVPLITADVFCTLLKNGANGHLSNGKKCHNLLEYAIQENITTIIHELMHKKHDCCYNCINKFMLMTACQMGHLKLFQYLLIRFEDNHKEDTVTDAILSCASELLRSNEHKITLKYLIQLLHKRKNNINTINTLQTIARMSSNYKTIQTFNSCIKSLSTSHLNIATV
jgi:hypothetical protein